MFHNSSYLIFGKLVGYVKRRTRATQRVIFKIVTQEVIEFSDHKISIYMSLEDSCKMKKVHFFLIFKLTLLLFHFLLYFTRQNLKQGGKHEIS